ncbi:MAG: UDP-N-acetyl glucosamine 2-epimerase [Acidobacteriota bacterium]|nr:UDP-N-acetyl glucosamine 2-epimerase [Acidobacteriota bacterium]
MKHDAYRLMLVAGARPNFMKIAPLMRELRKHGDFAPILVHSGQHYDEAMSQLFFDELEIPRPQINLEVGSASHAVQTARIMERFEPVCVENEPDAVLVVGDVNSTAACVLVAAKLGIATIHYEAGLRSRDRSMPEEINRIVTDSICDLFFTTSADADDNLVAEGKPRDRIHMVGNLMIDTLVHFLPKIRAARVEPVVIGGGAGIAGLSERNEADAQRVIDAEKMPGAKSSEGEKGVSGRESTEKVRGTQSMRNTGKAQGARPYAVMTFHRPNNVDDREVLAGLVDQWRRLAADIPIVFPVHPRTLKQLKAFGLWERIEKAEGMLLCEPLGYLPFMNLVCGAALVITDSGGIQEETTYLHIPCLTVRPSTERPVTIRQGSNRLIKPHEVESESRRVLEGGERFDQVPPLWDGRAAGRIVEKLRLHYYA